MQLQCSDNTLLLAELEQGVMRPVVVGMPGILDFTGQLKVVHQVFQTPVGLDVQHENRATGFLDLLRVKVDR